MTVCNKTKIVKFLLVLLSCSILGSCRMPESFGFYQPITMSLEIPDGPPEFKSGWYAGCSTGLANKNFANGFVYGSSAGPTYGNGVYQHSSLFQSGWGAGWFACVLHAEQFAGAPYRAFAHHPLQ